MPPLPALDGRHTRTRSSACPPVSVVSSNARRSPAASIRTQIGCPLSKLPRQCRCLLLPLLDHVQCSSIPRVLDGHCRDTAHTDEAEPEFDVLGDILKARRRDCLKAGLLALSADIRDECLVDIQ